MFLKMLDIVLSNRFKKDLRLAKKRGYNLDLLDEIVTKREPLCPYLPSET